MICEKNVLKEKERETLLRLHSPLDLHEFFTSFIGCWDYVYVRLDIVFRRIWFGVGVFRTMGHIKG